MFWENAKRFFLGNRTHSILKRANERALCCNRDVRVETFSTVQVMCLPIGRRKSSRPMAQSVRRRRVKSILHRISIIVVIIIVTINIAAITVIVLESSPPAVCELINQTDAP